MATAHGKLPQAPHPSAAYGIRPFAQLSGLTNNERELLLAPQNSIFFWLAIGRALRTGITEVFTWSVV